MQQGLGFDEITSAVDASNADHGTEFTLDLLKAGLVNKLMWAVVKETAKENKESKTLV